MFCEHKHFIFELASDLFPTSLKGIQNLVFGQNLLHFQRINYCRL